MPLAGIRAGPAMLADRLVSQALRLIGVNV